MIATPLNGSSGAGSGGGGSGGGGGGNSGSNNNNTSDGINRVGSGSGGGSNCHDTGTGSLQSASESKLWYSWKHLLLETNKKIHTYKKIHAIFTHFLSIFWQNVKSVWFKDGPGWVKER